MMVLCDHYRAYSVGCAVSETVERFTPKRQSDMIVQRSKLFVHQTFRSIAVEVQVVDFSR